MTGETNKTYTPNNQIQEKFRTLSNTTPDVSSFPTYHCEVGGQRQAGELSTSCFTCTQSNVKAFPTSPTRTQCDLHLYYQTPSQRQTPAIKLQAESGNHTLGLDTGWNTDASHSKSYPKILQVLTFQLKKKKKKKSLPHLSTLHMENLLVGNYFVCALPQGITDQDAKSAYLLPSKARSQTVNATKTPHHHLSPTHHTCYIAHPYFQSGTTQLQTTITENNH